MQFWLKGYGARRLLREFPDKGWKRLAVNRLLQKIRQTGKVDRQTGNGRPCSAHTDENIEKVEDVVLSQEDKPKTHRSTRQISRDIGIHRSTLHRIIHGDLSLKSQTTSRARALWRQSRRPSD